MVPKLLFFSKEESTTNWLIRNPSVEKNDLNCELYAIDFKIIR